MGHQIDIQDAAFKDQETNHTTSLSSLDSAYFARTYREEALNVHLSISRVEPGAVGSHGFPRLPRVSA